MSKEGNNGAGSQLALRTTPGRGANKSRHEYRNLRPRVAFVVQRYGEEVNGGAETQCRIIAERMSAHWDIEVLTSRACDYVSRFENQYPEGWTEVGGIRVRRFTIDRLRSEDIVFAALNRKVLERTSSKDEDKQWLLEIGPDCNGLYEYLLREDLDLVVFFTYLYATTTQALPLVRHKALLVPEAHDEPPIHARPFDTFFELPRALLCNTPEEESFLLRRSAGAISASVVAGVGVDLPEAVDIQLFRTRYNLGRDYILCVGRIQKEKGSDALFEYYLALPTALRDRYPLVLVGKAAMKVPASPYIRHLGFVSEAEKQSALAGATLVVAPSPFESLSLVLLEAWALGTPVVVNGRCEVLMQQVRRANGGLWYCDAEEFCEAIALLTDPGQAGLRRALGENGRAFVTTQCEWGGVLARYREALSAVQPGR
jgi:glycosyltransferase involved in cell wall biosynthesis